MSKNISLFPTINEESLNHIGFSSDEYMFFYDNGYNRCSLKKDFLNNFCTSFGLSDEEGIWNPNDYNIVVKRKYNIENPSMLFGENGVACEDSKIGIAIIWMSSSSNQRGSISIGDFDKLTKNAVFELDYKFDKSQFIGSIELKTVFYIKNKGIQKQNENHLANEVGFIVGEIDEYSLFIDGDGSMFPIYEIKKQGEPLWIIDCKWDDPNQDKFSECISININRAHKNYKYLDKTKRTYNDQLSYEIIANAMCVILSELKESGELDNAINGDDFEIGSISQAVNYFVNDLKWDVSSYEKMSSSIRSYFDKKE